MDKKQYELKDHLGNVRATIGDYKMPFNDATSTRGVAPFFVDEKSVMDYYAGGMAISDRSFSRNNSRYGYNSQEKSLEIDKFGNHNTAEYWEMDARILRRWNLDPVVKPFQSGFSIFGNNSILMNDYRGNEEFVYGDAKNEYVDNLNKGSDLLSYDLKGDRLVANQVADGPLTPKEQTMWNAINDKEVNINIYATRKANQATNMLNETKVILGGSFLGNFMSHKDKMEGVQIINFNDADKIVAGGLASNVGDIMFHESIECYIGVKKYSELNFEESFALAHKETISILNAKDNIASFTEEIKKTYSTTAKHYLYNTEDKKGTSLLLKETSTSTDYSTFYLNSLIDYIKTTR